MIDPTENTGTSTEESANDKDEETGETQKLYLNLIHK